LLGLDNMNFNEEFDRLDEMTNKLVELYEAHKDIKQIEEWMVRVLYSLVHHRLGSEEARKLFATYATKSYAASWRKKFVRINLLPEGDARKVSSRLALPKLAPPSKGALVQELVETNKALPHGARLGSRSITPGAQAKYINRVLKQRGVPKRRRRK
jgi:hypothetical protein